MGFETIGSTGVGYGLINFDAGGAERHDDQVVMTDALIARAVADGVSDVFFFCHGWRGDVPAAKRQYEEWIGAFMASNDHAKAVASDSSFRPLLIGVHWPSEPWGDEELRSGAFGAAPGARAPRDLLASYVERLGDSPQIRVALETILVEARHNAAPDELPPAVCGAYRDLNAALGLGSAGVAAAPDADREEFDPEAAFDAANAAPSFGGGSLGGLLGPLRQISYWTMKKRARTIGEGGLHDFLQRLQSGTAARETRIHLMGHSFGTIVIAGMIGGVNARGTLPRAVDSVVLVQGAVSLWSFAQSIPFAGAGAGYFNAVMNKGKIRGPLVTTQSKYDTAVGVLYPFASVFGSPSFASGTRLPKFGAIGKFGIQGSDAARRHDAAMQDAASDYVFDDGHVYNLDGSTYISHKEGSGGAHNDIAGPEVAHVIWSAARPRAVPAR